MVKGTIKNPFALPKAKKPKPLKVEPARKKNPFEAEQNRSKAIAAIDAGKCVSLVYLDFNRVAEVHTVGTTTAGRPAMSVWQVEGDSKDSPVPGWHLFCFDECFDVAVHDLPSLAPRPDYKKRSKQFRRIDREV